MSVCATVCVRVRALAYLRPYVGVYLCVFLSFFTYLARDTNAMYGDR